MEKARRKERKKGMETAIFLCEPPARINANSLILLPLFLVFPPTISRSPPPSPPHCALISLFSYHAELPAHIVFISFVYLLSQPLSVAPAHHQALSHLLAVCAILLFSSTCCYFLILSSRSHVCVRSEGSLIPVPGRHLLTTIRALL